VCLYAVLQGEVGRTLPRDDNKPMFLSELEPLGMTVDSGDKVLLRVQARGNPTPSFYW